MYEMYSEVLSHPTTHIEQSKLELSGEDTEPLVVK